MQQTIARIDGQRPIIAGRFGPLPGDVRNPVYQAFLLLWAGFTAAPILFGVDKFFNWMTFWPTYLWAGFPHLLHVSPQHFMYAVGVVEIAAGLLVLAWPRVGAWVVAAWLAGIVTNLVIVSIAIGGHTHVCSGCSAHTATSRRATATRSPWRTARSTRWPRNTETSCVA